MIARRLLLACITTIGLVGAGAPAYAEPLELAASQWPPYVDTGVQGNGFAMVLVASALERAGYETTSAVRPWPEALRELETGAHDVGATFWYSDERAEKLAFSEPWLGTQVVLVKRASSSTDYEELDDLRGLRIGIVDDYAYSREAVDTTGMEIVSSGSVRESLARLKAEELDLVVADRRVALAEINEQGLARRFEILAKPLFERGLRIAIPKTRADHAEIIAAFEQAIADMRKDGRFTEILASYRVTE